MAAPSTSSRSPFDASTSQAGSGRIVVALLPPATTVLQEVSYQYPLKLIAPSTTSVGPYHGSSLPKLVHTVFILTYGGGLVAGDKVDISIDLAPASRLCLLTQGSTKIFKTPDPALVSDQRMFVKLPDNATLCYLPDPVQPFRESAFEQKQTYVFSGTSHPNLCVCDWVCEGRSARQESWALYRYISRNEFWCADSEQGRRLLLRDNVILEAGSTNELRPTDRVDGAGVFGTLIVCGVMFRALGDMFLEEFRHLPRMGAKQWDSTSLNCDPASEQRQRLSRVDQESRDGVLWTAARSRGFVVVKFSARSVEGGKRWLHCMLKSEGTIERELGERALMCLR